MDKLHLDKIINYIVEDSTIEEGSFGDIINFPFLNYPCTVTNPNFTMRFLWNINPPNSFHIYCEELYGLRKEDIIQIWYKYSSDILTKVNNYKK